MGYLSETIMPPDDCVRVAFLQICIKRCRFVLQVVTNGLSLQPQIDARLRKEPAWSEAHSSIG